MTLPITIPIGDLAAVNANPRLRSRLVRFVVPHACRLSRLCIERSDCLDADQRALLAVLGDISLELRDATNDDRIARLCEQHDQIAEQLHDRIWEETSIVAASHVRIDDKEIPNFEPGFVFSAPGADMLNNPWLGISLEAKARVSLRIHNLGPAGEFRAIWLTAPPAMLIEAEQMEMAAIINRMRMAAEGR